MYLEFLFISEIALYCWFHEIIWVMLILESSIIIPNFKTVISILLKFQWQVTTTEKDIMHSNVSDQIETLCGSILIYTSNLCCEYFMAVLDIFFTSSFPSLSRFVTFWYHKYFHLWIYTGSCVKSDNKTIIHKNFIIWCFCILY